MLKYVARAITIENESRLFTIKRRHVADNPYALREYSYEARRLYTVDNFSTGEDALKEFKRLCFENVVPSC